MVLMNKLDFQLCQIPEHMRDVYVFTKNGRTYFTFSYEYLQSILAECTDVAVKRLQASNHLRVNFRKKKIINAKQKLFELLEPIN